MTPSMEVDPDVSLSPSSPPNRRQSVDLTQLLGRANTTTRATDDTHPRDTTTSRDLIQSLSARLSNLLQNNPTRRDSDIPINISLPRLDSNRDHGLWFPNNAQEDERTNLMRNINADTTEEDSDRQIQQEPTIYRQNSTEQHAVPVPAPPSTPSTSGPQNADIPDEQFRVEMRQLLRRGQHIIPFVVIFFLYFTYQHTKGILVFVIGSVAIIALDERFRNQVAMKDKASVLSLLGIVVICIVDVFVLCTINGDPSPFHTFLKELDASPSLGDVLWSVMVNDLILRLSSMLVKAVIALIQFKWICFWSSRLAPVATQHRRKRKLYAAVEFSFLMCRSAVAAGPWMMYYQALSSKAAADIFTISYLACKSFVISSQFRRVYLVLRAALTMQLEYGSYVTASEVAEAGSPECSICYDSMQVPVQLTCSHMFCEECVCEWFDRERSCPLCRADVMNGDNADHEPKPLYLDGSTSLLPQIL